MQDGVRLLFAQVGGSEGGELQPVHWFCNEDESSREGAGLLESTSHANSSCHACIVHARGRAGDASSVEPDDMMAWYCSALWPGIHMLQPQLVPVLKGQQAAHTLFLHGVAMHAASAWHRMHAATWGADWAMS